MSRRLRPARVLGHAPITARIIQGTWTARSFPGSPMFAAHCAALAAAFAGARPRARKRPLEELWTVVEERSTILERLHVHRDGVVALLNDVGARAARWVRSPLEWWPDRTATARGQVSDLIRHLFERYPAPRFFESTWWPRRPRHRDRVGFGWYVHVAGGGSIRTAPGLPTVLSRRAAHELGNAPSSVGVLAALRWAQVRALGGDDALCELLARSASYGDFADDALWLPLYAKLAAEPGLKLADVHPLIDYVRHQRRTPGGEAFTVEGRSLASLLRAVERWHAELAERAARGADWHTSWDGLSGTAPLHETDGGLTWSLDEICAYKDLAEEGARMRHCVVIHARDCAAGATSIWSLRASDGTREVSRVTLRITVRTREVVEARAFANRPISQDAARMIARWSARHHLRIGRLMVQ